MPQCSQEITSLFPVCVHHDSLSHDEETRKGPTINEFHNWGVGSKEDVGMRHMDSVWALNRRGQRSADVIDGCPQSILMPSLTSDVICRCQTYEGGFGGAPGMEAHGGYRGAIQ